MNLFLTSFEFRLALLSYFVTKCIYVIKDIIVQEYQVGSNLSSRCDVLCI